MMSTGILYSAVAKPNIVLVSSQCDSGDFESCVQLFLPNVPTERNTKTCYTSDMYNYHILVEDMLIYICAAEPKFGKNVPFAFLQEVKQKFTSGSLSIRALTASIHEFDRDFGIVLNELMAKFNSNQYAVDNIGKMKNQVNEVMDVMSQNIQKVVDRGEKLESLLDKTNELEVSSTQFRSTSRKVRRKMWCKNVKMWFIILGVVAVVITIIVLMSTNVIPVQ